MQNNIVHGDFEMKLKEEYDYQGAHIKIFEPDYNEIQQKESDSYIVAGLKQFLYDKANKNANK